MTAFATKGLMRMLDDAFRCPDCGKSRIQKATDWNTTSRDGERTHRAKSFEAFDPEVHCCCDRSGLRSIPYNRPSDNAAGTAGAATNTAGSTHELVTPAPQPCSLECPACRDTVKTPGLCVACDVWDDHNDCGTGMTGRVFYEGDKLPDRFGGGE